MTKLQLLHRALNERLMAAVEQIMEMVGGTVLEYEEETIRARKENEVLRRRLRWMEGTNPTDWPDDPDPSQQDECAVNFTFEQVSEALVIKTETTDHSLYNAAALPQSVDQGADVAGTSTGISYGLGGGMTWDSAQSYMAPLDFDPTSGNTRVRHWRGRNRRQRMSFACPNCGKVFGREQRLMIHMRIHSNERPYKYRRRKAFFYGDNKKKRKLQALSQLSGEIVVDLSDCSEQTNRSSASPERLAVTAPDPKEGPGGLSTESDHTGSDKEPENGTTTPVCHQRKKKRVANPMQCHCPHCPDRVFARPCQLAMHMKTHAVKALVNLPNQAQSGSDEKMDLKLNSQKRQRKNDAVKKAKDAGKSEFHCPKCDRVFAFECRLRLHMKSHKAKRSLLRKTLKMPIQTEPAKEETMEPVPKTTDVQYLQEVKKTFACPHCDKVFIREGWLQPHIRSQHRRVKKKRSQFEILLDDSRHSSSRSQLAYKKLLRKRTTVKQGVTEELKQKNKESKKVNVKPTPSSDESNLVVAGYNQQLRKRTTETQGVTKELKQKNEESKKVNNKPSQSSDESNLVVAGYTQQLCKRTTDTQGVTKELKTVSDKPSPSSESNLVVDVPKITTYEAEQSAYLLKRGTEESKCSPEQSKEDTSNCDRETSITTKPKRILPCKECGKEFVQEKKLKKHLRKHVGFKLRDERERKRKEGPVLSEDKLMEQPGMRWEEEDKERLDKTSTSNHNPNTTPQGSLNKELRKGKTRGQGPLPCPFCGKVFAWEMRLLMHMEIHCGEKPYSYRQRKDQFYGDPKRGQFPKIHNQEPPENNSSKSEESAGEEMMNEDQPAHLSSSKTHAVYGALASITDTTVMEDCSGSLGHLLQTAIEQPTTCNKSNQKTKPVLSNDVLSHYSLQPRIVLEPIMTECKYWSSVSGNLNSGHSERIGCDREETSSTVLVGDEIMDAVEDKIVGSDHGTQNKPEIHHSNIPLTEIFSVEVGSPQCDSQLDVELDNFEGQMAVESPERNNTESQQKEDSNCHFPCLSEKTAINMVQNNQMIIIDEELVESNASTAEHASECGRMKCDCNNISAMKLTVMPQTSDLQSLFKETSSSVSELVCVVLSDAEDNVDEDVLNSSKGLDDKRTASVPSIQNEQFDVDGKPAKNPSSDSNFAALDATESIKADKSTCVHAKAIEHTDVEVVISEGNDQSISNNPLTRDQMTSVTNRQTEDNPISSLREVSCQTSVMAFAGQASLSKINADKKPPDMEIVSGHERKNMKQCEQLGMQQ